MGHRYIVKVTPLGRRLEISTLWIEPASLSCPVIRKKCSASSSSRFFWFFAPARVKHFEDEPGIPETINSVTASGTDLRGIKRSVFSAGGSGWNRGFWYSWATPEHNVRFARHSLGIFLVIIRTSRWN